MKIIFLYADSRPTCKHLAPIFLFQFPSILFFFSYFRFDIIFLFAFLPPHGDDCGLDWIEQGLTSPPTQYRLSGRQFYRSKDPTNSIKVLKEKLASHSGDFQQMKLLSTRSHRFREEVARIASVDGGFVSDRRGRHTWDD